MKKMVETEEHRAVVIAAWIMQKMGCCKYEHGAAQCRRGYVTEETCRRCIRDWLMAKAREELRRERE